MDDDEEPLAHKPLRPPLSNSSSPRDSEPNAGDADSLRKWQEERIARKLRGEYESAVLHLSELINSNLSSRLRISSVRIEGAARTRKSFLGSIVNPLVALDEGSTLESVLHTARRISHRLQETDVFQTVEAKLEGSRDLLRRDGDVDIVFRTKEKGRFFFKTATEFGDGEGTASASGRIRNVFGGAETFEANFALGTQTRRSFQASLSAPLTHTLKTRGEISVFALDRDNTSFASSTEGIRGAKAVIRTGSRNTSNEFAYEAVLRHIGSLTPTASLSVREEAGHSFKSSISHTWLRDTRDDRITGTRGAYLKAFHELAGLGGGVSFCKSETQTQLSRPLLPGVTISFAARTGLLWSLSGHTSLADRFQLGGPSNIRMFKANSMGPRDNPDSLGGELFWSAGLSLITNLPWKPHWPLKTHMFLNGGRLDALDRSRPLVENITSTLSKPSVSAGVGLIYRFDPVRLEVNFGVPLVASKSDGVRRGFQVGMGLEFL